MGFRVSAADTYLFVFCSKHVTLYLLIYVDDALLIGNSQSAIHNCIQELSRHFSLKDLGPIAFFLGVQLLRYSNGVLLSQRQYITGMLQRSHMDAAKLISSPMAIHPKLTRHDGSPLPDPTEYRSIVGVLEYVAITRLDISFVVSKTTVARFSTESEFRACDTSTTEVVWISSLLRDLGINLFEIPTIWCDNIGATCLAANPVFRAWTRHVEVDFHFLRDLVLTKRLTVRFISSKDQVTNILTKSLAGDQFCFLRDKLHVRDEHGV
ncbi:PREDICTED: uncharacterized protein LOC104594416 [Nelumbo nucifera]|uniref:Uncharacterized protein LOC104594416 n=1 Tax=Nelumbo nucifera TaxID=4432 RepID=A0A1U7ZMS6_NELNU|nr:PREDICTED: uncharacterized protein LOC104594416 [Nelumbo nucifera]